MSYENILKINGIPIDELGILMTHPGMRVSAPEAITKFQRVPGSTMLVDTTLRDEDGNAPLKERTVTISLCTIGYVEDVASLQRKLAALTGSISTVQFAYEPCWQGFIQFKNWKPIYIYGTTAKYSFDLVMIAAPLAYGDTKVIAVGGETDFTVEGDRPCWAKFDLRVSDTNVLIATTESVKMLSFTGLVDGGHLIIDMAPQTRVVKLNGNIIVPSLQSDFFPLSTGLNHVSVTGATGTMSFTPLYMYGE